jgi:hypothetical protein
MDADNVTFPAVDPEAKPSHLVCMGLEFIRIDIYEAAQEEIERLKVIEAAHHRVIDALWGGEKSPAVGKERGSANPDLEQHIDAMEKIRHY